MENNSQIIQAQQPDSTQIQSQPQIIHSIQQPLQQIQIPVQPVQEEKSSELNEIKNMIKDLLIEVKQCIEKKKVGRPKLENKEVPKLENVVPKKRGRPPKSEHDKKLDQEKKLELKNEPKKEVKVVTTKEPIHVKKIKTSEKPQSKFQMKVKKIKQQQQEEERSEGDDEDVVYEEDDEGKMEHERGKKDKKNKFNKKIKVY
jgi:hypothetical protein